MSVKPIAAGDFDYIIVGGGSAGCVMASRLSEDPARRVLLIEAGQDFAPDAEPKEISDPGAPGIFFNFDYFMPMTGVGAALAGGGNAQVPLPQASVIGGGSSVNGMHAQRGDASDYDEYRQLGVTGWSWDEVLPFFKKTETDLDFNGEDHGSSGPIKIKRQGPETWSKLSLAVAKAFDAEGIPHVQDLNASSGPGYGAVPLNATERRMSSAAAYLTAAVRARPNLAIRSRTKVRRVVFEGTRAQGVELADAATVIKGANIILCCGAYLSPEVLLRSGIGAAQDLLDSGIPVVADRQGVGKNFQNHAIVNVFAHITPAARQTGRARAPCLMVARMSSNNPSCPPADLIFNLWERAPGAAPNNFMGLQMADFMFVLNKAYSVGEIVLDPANPAGPAKVKTNLLSDQRDLDRLMEGFKYLAALAQSSQMSGLVNEVFAMKPSPVGIMMLQHHWKARVISTLAGAALAGPAGLRRMFLKNAIIPIADIIATPAALEAHLRESAGPTHSVGTCSLGDPQAPATVVDEHCKVVGVEGLRVVDASIFPRTMRAGTNLPTMMVAEKIAHAIQQGH